MHFLEHAIIRPAFIAFPRSAEDVQRCLKCSLNHSEPCVVKGGGHSLAGYSTISGKDNFGFVIHLGKMRNVVVGESEAIIQGGAVWRDAYQKLNGTDYLIVGGVCPTVGIAGFTQGGGCSLLTRRFGLALDNVKSMTMVTANGSQVVVANKTINADLFWALRGGGGGNFGIVTELTFILHPAFPQYVVMALKFEPGSISEHAFAAFGELLSQLPDELYAVPALLPNKLFEVSFLYLGSISSDVVGILQPLVGLAKYVTFQNFTTYYEALTMVAGNIPDTVSNPVMIRGCILTNIGRDMARVFFEYDLPKGCFASFVHVGGAVETVTPKQTAYYYRTAQFLYFSPCIYTTESEETNRHFINRLYTSLERSGYCTGNYVNDMDRDLLDWQEKYYGDNYQRLLEIKEQWNPIGSGFFHFLQEIGSNYTSLVKPECCFVSTDLSKGKKESSVATWFFLICICVCFIVY